MDLRGRCLCAAESRVDLPEPDQHMVSAIPLKVPVVVSMDVGENWLEAH